MATGPKYSDKRTSCVLVITYENINYQKNYHHYVCILYNFMNVVNKIERLLFPFSIFSNTNIDRCVKGCRLITSV